MIWIYNQVPSPWVMVSFSKNNVVCPSCIKAIRSNQLEALRKGASGDSVNVNWKGNFCNHFWIIRSHYNCITYSNYPGVKLQPACQRSEDKIVMISSHHHILTSSAQLQNGSFPVVKRTRTLAKCTKMENAHTKRAKLLFFIVKYANMRRSCYRLCCGFLSSLIWRWEK